MTETVLNEFQQLADQLVSGVIQFIPDLVLVIVLFLAGLLLARITQRLVRRFILYLHSQINEQLRNRYLSIDLNRSAILISKACFWMIMIFISVLIIQVLEFPFLKSWLDGLILYLPNALAALVIIFIGYVAGQLMSDLVVSTTVGTGISQGKYLGRLVKYIFLFVSVIIAADQIGIDVGFLTDLIMIVLGVMLFGAALAFGLGAKTSVSNILGSFYLQKTFKEGNMVQVGDVKGTIVKITPTSVMIQTDEGMASIPSKEFSEQTIALITKNQADGN